MTATLFILDAIISVTFHLNNFFFPQKILKQIDTFMVKEAVCKFSPQLNVVSCREQVVVMVACKELDPLLHLQYKRL